MAFNNFGNVVFLAQGGTLRYFYFFGGSADRGFQHASADIKTPNNGAEVVAFDQSKRKAQQRRDHLPRQLPEPRSG